MDESPLTGESQPVEKDASASEIRPDVLAGTTVLSGRGVLRVTVTGPRTRYGQIGALIARIRPPPTPLQRLIGRLVWQATFVAAGFCVAVAAVELAYGHGWIAAVTAGISLAIAALPVVITPHSAFYSREAMQRILDTTVANIHGFLAGQPQNVVSSTPAMAVA